MTGINRHSLRNSLLSITLLTTLVGHGILPNAFADYEATSSTPAKTSELHLLRHVEIPQSAYKTSKSAHDFDVSSVTAIVEQLDKSRNIALHMELIRRAYQTLSADEGQTLVDALQSRHHEIDNDTYRYFDYGYGDLMMNGGKKGLYFLRKSNDKLKTQFTSLAYAMAQADTDINVDFAKRDALTRRKQDVTYKLSDAVMRDAESHAAGFWPSYTAVLSGLKKVSAYDNFAQSDLTTSYVPYGQRIMPNYQPAEVSVNSTNCEGASEASDTMSSCALSKANDLDFKKLFRTLQTDINGDEVNEKIHFFNTDTENMFRVVIVNKNNGVLADLTSPVAPYILEDLDGDDVPEVVIRQFKASPQNPVKVYRFDDCKFELDSEILGLFK